MNPVTIKVSDANGDLTFTGEPETVEFAVKAYIYGMVIRDPMFEQPENYDRSHVKRAKKLRKRLKRDLKGVGSRLSLEEVQHRLYDDLDWSCGPAGDPSVDIVVTEHT